MRLRRRVPVIVVHGFDGYAAKPATELSAITARLGKSSVAVGFYAGDTGFPVTLPGDGASTDTSIRELGSRLAQHVASLRGPVDLVGHSMGGLVVQEALAVLPADAVRRIVMLGVPFAGLPSAVGTDVAQCREMSPGSDFLAAAAARGWRAGLCIGSEADEAVPIGSALAAGVGRSVHLPAAMGIHHGDLVADPRVLDRVAAALR